MCVAEKRKKEKESREESWEWGLKCLWRHASSRFYGWSCRPRTKRDFEPDDWACNASGGILTLGAVGHLEAAGGEAIVIWAGIAIRRTNGGGLEIAG